MAFPPWGRGRLSLFSKDLSVHCLQDAGFPEQGGGLINDLKKKGREDNQEPGANLSNIRRTSVKVRRTGSKTTSFSSLVFKKAFSSQTFHFLM